MKTVFSRLKTFINTQSKRLSIKIITIIAVFIFVGGVGASSYVKHQEQVRIEHIAAHVKEIQPLFNAYVTATESVSDHLADSTKMDSPKIEQRKSEERLAEQKGKKAELTAKLSQLSDADELAYKQKIEAYIRQGDKTAEVEKSTYEAVVELDAVFNDFSDRFSALDTDGISSETEFYDRMEKASTIIDDTTKKINEVKTNEYLASFQKSMVQMMTDLKNTIGDMVLALKTRDLYALNVATARMDRKMSEFKQDMDAQSLESIRAMKKLGTALTEAKNAEMKSFNELKKKYSIVISQTN